MMRGDWKGRGGWAGRVGGVGFLVRGFGTGCTKRGQEGEWGMLMMSDLPAEMSLL